MSVAILKFESSPNLCHLLHTIADADFPTDAVIENPHHWADLALTCFHEGGKGIIAKGVFEFWGVRIHCSHIRPF